MNAISSYSQSGDSDMISTGWIICGFFAVLALLSVLMIGLTIRRSKRGGHDWIKISAEKSGLSEREIREFDQQALTGDSYILKLVSGVNAAMSAQRDGILTKEYVYLADLNQTVIPVRDILSACLVDCVYYIGKQHKAVHYVNIKLLSKQGTEAFAEVTSQTGRALIDMLLHINTGIDTCGDSVMTEKEYEAHKKRTQPA